MNSNNIPWILVVSSLFPWAAMAVTALITPRLTRPDLFFAVTVKPTFRLSPEGSEILRQYTRIVLIVALMGLLPLGFLESSPPLFLLGLMGPIAVELAGCFGAFLVARRRTMPYHVEPTAEREAVITPRRVTLPGGLLAQAGPFLILAVICICLGMNWDRIPARIPIHWGAAGMPNGWAAKTPPSVFGTVAIGFLTCLLLAGLCLALTRGVRRIYSSGRAGVREEKFVRAISYFLLGMEYWLALLMGSLGLAALRPDPRAPLPAFWPILIGQTIIVGSIFVLAWRMGQGGWRLDKEKEALSADRPPVGDRTPDECWKLGVFYFNRDDAAVFVEKRFGVGWTLNFGNPRSWWVIGALLAFILAMLAVSFITVHSHS
jgi:uncharacterized membrane protein